MSGAEVVGSIQYHITRQKRKVKERKGLYAHKVIKLDIFGLPKNERKKKKKKIRGIKNLISGYYVKNFKQGIKW